jgi:hypothetical protein
MKDSILALPAVWTKDSLLAPGAILLTKGFNDSVEYAYWLHHRIRKTDLPPEIRNKSGTLAETITRKTDGFLQKVEEQGNLSRLQVAWGIRASARPGTENEIEFEIADIYLQADSLLEPLIPAAVCVMQNRAALEKNYPYLVKSFDNEYNQFKPFGT